MCLGVAYIKDSYNTGISCVTFLLLTINLCFCEAWLWGFVLTEAHCRLLELFFSKTLANNVFMKLALCTGDCQAKSKEI